MLPRRGQLGVGVASWQSGVNWGFLSFFGLGGVKWEAEPCRASLSAFPVPKGWSLFLLSLLFMDPFLLFVRRCGGTHDYHLLSLHLLHEGSYSVSRIAIADGKYVLRPVVKHLSTGV